MTPFIVNVFAPFIFADAVQIAEMSHGIEGLDIIRNPFVAKCNIEPGETLETTNQGSRWRRSGPEPRGLRRVTFQSLVDEGARRGCGHVDKRDRAPWRLTRRLLCP